MIARVHLKLGNTGGALEWLEKLHNERWPWMPGLQHDPEWDRLRTHPRFQALMASVDLHSAAALGAARREPNARIFGLSVPGLSARTGSTHAVRVKPHEDVR
jgi:hypothetical protein